MRLPSSGGTATFKYDPLGRRIQKVFTTGSTTTTNYLYDGNNDIEELNASGSIVARYAQGQNVDEPLAESRSSTTSLYEADGLGSVTSLTNSSGTIANSYTYDSFGKPTASSGSIANPFQYTGRDFDSETGLRYYRARYYDPTSGRFLSEDPIGFKGGVNLYSYVLNNPVGNADPSGEDSNSDYCRAIAGKIDNLKDSIGRRQGNMHDEPSDLPWSCEGDKAKPSLSKKWASTVDKHR